MATKFLQLDEAAKLLGVTPEALSEMRLSSQIYGYRDGGSWKFKQDDIERLKEERAVSGQKPLSGETAQEDFLPVSDTTNDDDDMILLSEVELGESGTGPSSTVIGEEAKAVSPGDSDLKIGSDLHLAGDSSPALSSDVGLGSGIQLVGAGSGIQGSDVELAPIDDDVLSGSSKEMPSDLSESATVLKSASDLSLGESALISGAGLSDLSGARPRPGAPDPGDSSLLLSGEPSDLAMGSKAGDSSLHLADDDVLGAGSGSGSDITHRPSESGILLIDPSDSGLSLESPPDLSTGSDPMLETTNFTVDEGSGVKADDDFLLTPLEEAGEDDSDSGSQVIMLDTEGEVDEATATLLASQIPGLTNSMLVEEESPLAGGLGGMGGAEAEPSAMPRRGAAAAAAGPVVYASPEVPFSVLSVLGLALCTIALTVCGIMMYDVVRNMWSWDSPYQVDSVLIKQFKF
jgi:hypothetical protein